MNYGAVKEGGGSPSTTKMERALLIESAVPVPDTTSSAVPAAVEIDGFEIWEPAPMPANAGATIIGSEYGQVVEISLVPGSVITSEPGTMLHTSEGIKLNADTGGCGQACKRCCCAGESFFRLRLENKTGRTEFVGLTPSFPARVVPINLAEHSGLVLNRGAFMAAMGTDWRFELRRVDSAGVCCCAGQGLFMNTLHGSSMAFLNAGGTVLTKTLGVGERLVVDKHSLLAFERTVQIGIRRTGGCLVACCARQGLYNAVLEGPGFVMVHSMALAKLKRAVRIRSDDGGLQQ